MSALLYTIGIRCYALLIRLASPFSHKAKRFLSERRDQKLTHDSTPKFWFHCASHGEFETISTLLDATIHEHGIDSVIVSFFSPSGMIPIKASRPELRLVYMPLDIPSRVSKFIDQICPKLLVIAENDFWYNTIGILNKKNIPVISIGTNFREQDRLRPLEYHFVRKHLSGLKMIFLKSKNAKNYLASHGLTNAQFVGNPRLDSIARKRQEVRKNEQIADWVEQGRTLLFASLHQSDWHVFEEAVSGDLFDQYIIVPHDYDELPVDRFSSNKGLSITLLSQADDLAKSNTVYVDKFGLLFDLYQYADVVYVGGGFKEGVHNLLEPLIFDKPIIIGPKNDRFAEIAALISADLINVISDTVSLETAVQDIDNQDDVAFKSDLDRFFDNGTAASDQIFKYLKSNELI